MYGGLSFIGQSKFVKCPLVLSESTDLMHRFSWSRHMVKYWKCRRGIYMASKWLEMWISWCKLPYWQSPDWLLQLRERFALCIALQEAHACLRSGIGEYRGDVDSFVRPHPVCFVCSKTGMHVNVTKNGSLFCCLLHLIIWNAIVLGRSLAYVLLDWWHFGNICVRETVLTIQGRWNICSDRININSPARKKKTGFALWFQASNNRKEENTNPTTVMKLPGRKDNKFQVNAREYSRRTDNEHSPSRCSKWTTLT